MSDMRPAPYHSSGSRAPFADLRPSSPAQLAVIGLGIWLVGAFIHIHVLSVLVPVGIGLLLIAGLGQLLKPRNRTMYWRGREIDLDDGPSASTRLYRAIFKR